VVCEDATIKSSFPHLIKATFCIAKKNKKRCFGSTIFRFRVVQVASIFFKFNMSNNVKGMMWEIKDVNPFTQKRLKIISNNFGPQA